MKKTFILVITIIFFLSCKDEPKEQIRLSDYNHQETESAVQNGTIVDMVANDSTAVETNKDSTAADSTKVGSDEKIVEEEKQ